MKNKVYQGFCTNPLNLLSLTVAVVFINELLQMMFYKGLNIGNEVLVAMLQSLLIASALYVLLFRPLKECLRKSKLGEVQLKVRNQSLEEQVLEITNELAKINKLLEIEISKGLLLSEESYENVLDNLEVGVSVIGPDMRIIRANKYMHNWRPDVDFSQKPLCYHANRSKDAQQVCEDCPVEKAFIEGKISCVTVKRVINGNLRSHKIIASPLRDNQGNIVAVTEVIEDVTEQKQLQEDLEQAVWERTYELSEAEARYRSLVQNSSEGIYIFDPATLKIQEANKQFLALIGYNQNEIVGLNVMEFVITDKENIDRAIHQMADENKTVKMIRQYKKKDSSLIDVEVSGSIIQYGKSKVCLVNVHDITERKRGEEAIQQSVLELRKTLYAGIDALIYIVEKRDPYTAGHQKRVATFAQAIAKEMGLEDGEIETIRIAGILHDIGKIYVPSDILNKPGRLTDMEMGIIKTHPQVSYDIIKQMPFKTNVAEIVLQHHEREDGSGYPKGLRGKEISIGAKILGVTDVVEAMSSHRPYRPAIGWKFALQEIVDKKGLIYDPEVVEACLRLSDNQGYEKILHKTIVEAV